MEGDETSQISTTWDLTRLRLFALALDVCFFFGPRSHWGVDLRLRTQRQLWFALQRCVQKSVGGELFNRERTTTTNIGNCVYRYCKYIYVYIYIHIDTHILKMVRTPLFIGSHMSNRQNCCINNTNLVFLRLGLSEVAQNLN